MAALWTPHKARLASSLGPLLPLPRLCRPLLPPVRAQARQPGSGRKGPGAGKSNDPDLPTSAAAAVGGVGPLPAAERTSDAVGSSDRVLSDLPGQPVATGLPVDAAAAHVAAAAADVAALPAGAAQLSVPAAAAELPNGTISAAAELPNGTISAAAELPNGTISAAAELPNGTISAAAELPNGTISAAAEPQANGAADPADPSGQPQRAQQQQPPLLQDSSSSSGPSFLQTGTGGFLDFAALRRLQAPAQQGGAAAAPSSDPATAAPPLPATGQPPQQQALASATHAGTLWGLLVLSLAYLHHSTSGFALPALLPIISEDLHLSDTQGALLTAGYTVLYALALVPVGLLADRVDRPRLLAGGITLWSILTIVASQAQSFGQLLATRVGFAAAQATQNPICFSLIPELFPKNRTTAMAVYNTAIYAGRALSFAALIIAGQLGVPQSMIGEGLSVGYTLVPLDKVDLSLVSVLYTQGDYAAVSPIYTYALDDDDGLPIESAFSAWRMLLRWLGPPGLVMAALALLTVEEPRQRGRGGQYMPLVTLTKDSVDDGDLQTPVGALGQPTDAPGTSSGNGKTDGIIGGGAAAAAAANLANGGSGGAGVAGAAAALAPGALVSAPESAGPGSVGESLSRLLGLVRSPGFLALTGAAALNDVGSWALVSWQATFYQRVYELQPATYAPLLAVVIPVGGIIGGVGAGVFGDWLNRIGARGWLTAGSCVAAAPLIAVSLLVPDYKQSFAALLVGFALSECWRAPAAVMVREVSPPGLGSTASAMHLCMRNLVGGLGPIGVALLSAKVGLQMAMLLVPACYLLSGVGLAVTEGVIKAEKEAAKAGRHQHHHQQQQ